MPIPFLCPLINKTILLEEERVVSAASLMVYYKGFLYSLTQTILERGNFMITDSFTYVSVLIFFSSLILITEKATGWAVFRFIPAVVFVYLFSMLLSTLGVWSMTATKPVYKDLAPFLTYAMIFMMLLQCDIRKVFRIAPRMLFGFFSATLTIAVGFAVAFLIMKGQIGNQAWMSLGALSGSWIGGYDNIAEIQTMLRIPAIDMEGAFLIDSINYSLWFMFLLWFITLAPLFNRWNKADTTDLDVVSQELEEKDAAREGRISFQGVFLLLGVSFLVASIGGSSGMLLYAALPFFTKSIWTILFIATFGLIAAVSPLSRIAGSLEIANVLLYALIALMASRSSFGEILDAPLWILTGFIILGVHFALMVLIARLFKLDMFTLCISSIANIGGVASTPIVASLYSGALIPVGILMSLIGHIIGTPLGLWIAHLLELLV